MPFTELLKRFRHLLSDSADINDIPDFINHLDEEVLNISSSDDDSHLRRDFEEELQAIYDKHVNFVQLRPVELFLSVLIHARPIFRTASFIVTWWDLLLRPALREPRLAPTAVEQAKQLVIESLENDEDDAEKVKNFRRRLVDLFLLDVLNESSGKDILEWAQLDEEQRGKNKWWKRNLEDILVRYGLVQPEVRSYDQGGTSVQI